MPLAVTPAAERTEAGNFSSVDYVWLNAQIADPLERLRATSAAAEATKEHFAKTKDVQCVLRGRIRSNTDARTITLAGADLAGSDVAPPS